MPELQAQRTLVKSPPELWAEVSDPGSLARHLGELGEITITRVEQESTVAWEGERASGTVALEPAGWGTRVTLTAEMPEAEVPDVVVAEPEPDPEPVVEVTPEPPRVSRFAALFGRLRRRAPEVVVAEPPEPEPEPEPEPVVQDPAEAALLSTLTAALDSLGTAHHRPFSRG